ncbi:MAG: hypothetical protein IPI73_10580 [Betaproteobacteria bacterium]|nr:hypothetical protein [Betaproteobacteria bacterium]
MTATAVQSAASGDNHVLALKSDGTVEAWGSNEYGQLGDGGIVDRSFPVLALTGVRAAVGGSAHSLAVKTDGSLWSWGDGGAGQLGDGLRTARGA